MLGCLMTALEGGSCNFASQLRGKVETNRVISRLARLFHRNESDRCEEITLEKKGRKAPLPVGQPLECPANRTRLEMAPRFFASKSW